MKNSLWWKRVCEDCVEHWETDGVSYAIQHHPEANSPWSLVKENSVKKSGGSWPYKTYQELCEDMERRGIHRPIEQVRLGI